MGEFIVHHIGDIIMPDNKDTITLKGPAGLILLKKNDKTAVKLAMLFEHFCLGTMVTEVVQKYGFSRSRFYQVKHAFERGGSEALFEKKKGPQKRYKRTENIVNQIIRMRFLDPDASVPVITQKLKQMGFNISQRSVERTITEYGIQKKTPFVKSGKEIKQSRSSSDKT
jgi:transposase